MFMRKSRLTLGMAVVCMFSGLAWADGVVRLDGPGDLEQLRHSNFRHYQQALKIMGEANELCRPHAGNVEKTGAQDVACSQMLLRTSNPAKREITFRLDSTKYVALVAMTDDPPKLVAAASR
jgi:hypothetical protein